MVKDDLERRIVEIADNTKCLCHDVRKLYVSVKNLYNKVVQELRDVQYKLDHLIEVRGNPTYYRGGLRQYFDEAGDYLRDSSEE